MATGGGGGIGPRLFQAALERQGLGAGQVLGGQGGGEGVGVFHWVAGQRSAKNPPNTIDFFAIHQEVKPMRLYIRRGGRGREWYGTLSG
jgi:hypothetical protein